MEILWNILESEKTFNMGKQHAYIPKISRGGNKRNKSLCGKFAQAGEDGKPEMFDNMVGELLYLPNVCKICLKIYNKTTD